MSTFIIAEAGVNHNGSLDLALQLIDAASDARADAVKFQTFNAESLASKTAGKAAYQIRNSEVIETQYEMLKKLELDEKSHEVMISHCEKRNIEFLSTPFDSVSLDLLVNRFDLSLIKISSGDITNAPFLLDIARAGKPVILSTGMSTLGEIEQALGVLAFGYTAMSEQSPSINAFEEAYCSTRGRRALSNFVTLLHCTSEYPAPLEDVNLRAMETMSKAFSLPIGYSDHTDGIAVALAAVALGATVIEKHFTLDRSLPGPDHKASLEPVELRAMVESIRNVEIALGGFVKHPSRVEIENRKAGRKSLVANKKIKKGDRFTLQSITSKRPGTGVNPIHYWEWLERTADRDFAPDEMLSRQE